MPLRDQSGYLRGDPVAGAQLGPLVIDGTVGVASLDLRYAGGKLAKTAQVTLAGDTTVLTPAAGRRIKLYWISAINDPDAAQSPLITIRFAGAATNLYSAYALAHWEVFTGPVDAGLVVNLDQAGDVAVTIHYEEVA